MSSLARIPLFDRLEQSQNVLVAGAGGGFDIYAGLPLAFALAALGKNVHLANLSFSSLVDPDFWIAPGLARVGPDSAGDDDYFRRGLSPGGWQPANDRNRFMRLPPRARSRCGRSTRRSPKRCNLMRWSWSMGARTF